MIIIGLIVIGIILIAIIGAFIVSPAFRKDVIASEGEASVFGLINVKGVIIVLLTAIFVGAFVYILKLHPPLSTTEITPELAIDYLKKHNSVSYSIKGNQINRGFDVWANASKIGQLQHSLNEHLIVTKNPNNVNNWLVEMDHVPLGTVRSRVQQEQIFWHKGQNPQCYEQKKVYRVGNLDFYFRIDSIYSVRTDSSQMPYYVFRFGEGSQPDKIIWRSAKEEYNKTDNGRIDLNNGLKHICDKQWLCNYYVGLGVGLPGGENPHVEMLNMMVIQSKLE